MRDNEKARDAYRKKVRHFDEPGHAHFLTFSCYQRLPLLSKDRTRSWFVDALETARRKHQFDLWAWVIMPEHVHLLIWPRVPDYKIGPILSDIKRPVGQQVVARLESNSPGFLERLTIRNRSRTYRRFWQAGPGQDHNVYDPAAAHAITQYIHLNPVRRTLADLAEDWLWSSAAEWSGKVDSVLHVDRTMLTSTEFVT